MKNKTAIFLTTIFILTAFAGFAKAQNEADSYFAEQVKMTKPETNQTERDENMTAPANDNFASAETVALGANGVSILTRNNISASKETNEPNHAENAGGSSVWFNFTPTVTKAVEIRTISNDTNFDTTLAVYKGDTLQSLVLVGSNDDCFRSECGTRSRVRLLLEAGTTYRIAVDGYYNGVTAASGTFMMILEQYSSPFEFDNINQAYNLGVANAGVIGMTNHNATLETGEPSHANGGAPGGKSVWFKFRTLANRAMTFQMTNDFAGEMAVYMSFVEFPTFDQLNKIDSSADHIGVNGGRTEVNFWANATFYYFIVVDYNANQNQAETGNFQLKFFQTKLRYSMRLDNYTNHTSLSVFRPSEGIWYSHQTYNNMANPKYVKFGLPGDVPVPADYDGDAITNYAVTRNQNGLKHWYILDNDGTPSYFYAQWGLATDKAVVGDFDRDGRADPTVIRSAGGQLVWYVSQSKFNGSMRAFVFGLSGDRPVLGDFDGDGATDVTVARNESGNLTWYILRSGNNQSYSQMSVVPFGLSSDIPAVEDYDGDGKSDIALFRPSNGTWYILRSSTNEVQATPFGLSGDKPQPGDYDNDGKSELALFRPSEGKWHFWFSSTNTQTVRQWGLATDIPVSSLSTLSQ